MKIINTFYLSPDEVSIYVSSKEMPTRIWATAHAPYPERQITNVTIAPRSLKSDILEAWQIHLPLNIIFLGLPCLGYIGFWAYERCVPLWNVHIRYERTRTNQNPLHNTIELVVSPSQP